MAWPCNSFIDGHSYKCIVILINHDFLPILMLLYIMLYIVLAYSMFFAALTSAVCLYNASSFFCYRFLQMLFVSCIVLVY